MPKKKNKKLFGITLPLWFNGDRACIAVLLLVIATLVASQQGIIDTSWMFPAGEVPDTGGTTDNSTTVYHIEGRLTWENEVHDYYEGIPLSLWINCYDQTTDALLDKIQIEVVGTQYFGLWEYSWNLAEIVRLEIDYDGDLDWDFRNVDGHAINPLVTSGTDVDVYAYKMAEQNDFAVIHISWHTHLV